MQIRIAHVANMKTNAEKKVKIAITIELDSGLRTDPQIAPRIYSRKTVASSE